MHHNFISFMLVSWIELHSMNISIFEGIIYGEKVVSDVPFMVCDGAFTYVMTMPTIYFLQTFVLGANLQLNLPHSLDGIWWGKWHLTGWVPIE